MSNISLRERFETMMRLEEGQRASWLDDQDLPPEQLAQLRVMMAVDSTTGDAFAHQARQHLQSILRYANNSIPDDLLNAQVGPYRLTQIIGSGGMARVYLGQRSDGKFNQEVAVKILRQSLDSDLDRKLFEREQHALASLDHPNVAKFLDGGVTSQGQPYLVMDLIRGKTLLAHCDSERLSPLARVQLFAQVCDGAQAAHRALIVHRDIKPSNIVVNFTGVPKLLDFGVAKLLRPDDAEQTQTYAPLTPAYAAPEQLDGRPITAATDVYSLGMVLHELLTGVRRKQGETTRASEVIKRLAGRHTSVDIVRFLTGDVDNILRQAMSPEASERYASAGELAADLRRFMSGEPVLATPPSVWYRFKKLLRRNRVFSVVTACAVLALFTSFALTVQQRNVARRERARAEAAVVVSKAELAHANSLREFMQALFEPAQIGLSDQAAPSVRELVIEGEKALRANRQLQPEAKVEMLTFFAFLHESVGELKMARNLANEAVKLAETTAGQHNARYAAALAMRGFTAVRMEDYASAKADLDVALPQMQALGVRGWMLSNAMQAMATVENINGHAERALAYAQADLAERIRSFGPDDRRVGVGYNNVADSLEAMGRYLESIPAYQSAYQIQLQRLGPESRETVTTLAGLASSHWRAGHWLVAEKLFVQADTAFDRIGGKAQIVRVYQIQKQCQLALMLARQATMNNICMKAESLTANALGAESSAMGDIWASHLEGAIEQGDIAAAQSAYRKADRLFPNDIPNRLRRGRLQSTWAEFLLRTNQAEKARTILPNAIENISARPHKIPLLLAQARFLLACHLAPGPECYASLRADFDQTRAAVLTLKHPQILQADSLIAATETVPAVAVANLTQSLAFASAELPENHVRLIEGRLWLARALADRGDCRKSAELSNTAVWRRHLLLDLIRQLPKPKFACQS